jgi:DNA-binding NarL/FixJ family response regulator
VSAIRVLLVDDHPVFRYGLRAVLDSDPAIELVGESATGDDAVAKARELLPDVVLMDLSMPGLPGIEAIRRLHDSNPEIKVLVLTMFDDGGSVLAAVRAGAQGYLVKGADRAEVLRAIRAAAAGEAIFSPAAARQVSEALAAPRRATASATIPGLTAREHELLELIEAGATNAAIAERLTLSPKTVRNYVSTIMGKLDVDSRGDLIVRARLAGVGRDRNAG